MKIARFLPVLTFLSLSVLSIDARAIKLPPPPTIAQLAGVWIGPDESGAVLRLELDGHGVGKLQVSERGSPAVLSSYAVTLNKERMHPSFPSQYPQSKTHRSISTSLALR